MNDHWTIHYKDYFMWIRNSKMAATTVQNMI